MKKYMLFTIMFLMFFFSGYYLNATSNQNYVRITTFNPYSMTVKLEIKCDWDADVEEFKYHKFITIEGKKSTDIIVPNTFKNCQIWSKVKIF